VNKEYDICQCGHPWDDHNENSSNHECLKVQYVDDGKLLPYDMCVKYVQSNLSYLEKKYESKL
jgi:hypothetical protein